MRVNSIAASGLIAALCFWSLSHATAEEKSAEALSPGVAKLVAADTPLRKGDRIAFFGDSVTDQGGYIQLMRDAIQASPSTKDLGVELLKHGLNGGRVPTVLEGKSPWGNLGGTMESLIKKEKPNVIIIYLGINDVWHGAKGTSKEDFEAGLKTMIAMGQKANAVVILCTPTVIGEETEKNKLNDKLDEYADIMRKLAADNKVALCDLHKAFIEELKRINPDNKHAGHLTYDGVHMIAPGNRILADMISSVLETTLKAR